MRSIHAAGPRAGGSSQNFRVFRDAIMSRNTHPGHHRGGMCGVRHCPGCSGKNFADISKRCYVCHYMFVRFRQSANRLQLSLVESCRVGVKVRHEHVASLGAIGMSPSVADRVAFWGRLHERLAKLSNRVDPKAHALLPLKGRHKAGCCARARGTCSVDFWDLPHFKLAAPATHSVQPVKRHATANQKSRQSRPTAPRS